MIFINDNKTFYITPRSNDFNLLKFTNESTSEVLEVVNFTVEYPTYGVKITVTDNFDLDTFYTLEVVQSMIERVSENGAFRLTENGINRISENSETADTIVYKGKVFATNRSKVNYSVNANNYITI